MTMLMNKTDHSGFFPEITAFDGCRLGANTSNLDDQLRLRTIAETVHMGINATTGLASDFLNQFNEVSMVLNMISDNEDMLEDIECWQPRSYVEHFRASCFKDLDLILEAYGLCPDATRVEFDRDTEQLGTFIIERLNNIATSYTDIGERAEAYGRLAAEIDARVDMLSSLIHPTSVRPTSAGVSTIFALHRANL